MWQSWKKEYVGEPILVRKLGPDDPKLCSFTFNGGLGSGDPKCETYAVVVIQRQTHAKRTYRMCRPHFLAQVGLDE